MARLQPRQQQPHPHQQECMSSPMQPLSLHFLGEIIEFEVESTQTIGEVKSKMMDMTGLADSEKITISEKMGEKGLPDNTEIGGRRHLVVNYKLKGGYGYRRRRAGAGGCSCNLCGIHVHIPFCI